MGAVWLGSLPAVIAAAGLNVKTWPGWQWRSRSTGGYDKVLGIGVHHDAIKQGTDLNSRCRAAWDSQWNSTRPVGAIWVHTDGTIMVGAAGATNTQGTGGPFRFSKGTVPLDQGNRYMVSIEASNDGIGQPWPQVQQDAYVRLCAALCRWLDLDPRTDVIAHFEWSPGRKIDPAGQSRYAPGRAMWNMPLFRSDVSAAMTPKPPPPPPPPPPQPPMQGVPDVFHAINPFRNSDTRVFGGAGIAPNTEHRFGLNPGVIPANATAVALNLAVLPSGAAGFATVWPDGMPRPDASLLNFEANGAHNGAILVGIQGNHFRVFLSERAHVIVDVTGYWTP